MANILRGRDVANVIDNSSKKELEFLKSKGIVPCLAIIRVGDKEADISYEKAAIKKCEDIGIKYRQVDLPIDIKADTFYQNIQELNNDSSIQGILLLRPLPKHINEEKACNLINPLKDIDACSNISLSAIFTGSDETFIPCTAKAAMEILNYYQIGLKGKNVVVIGRSLVIGKPLAMLLLKKDATVTICHSKTKNISQFTKKADIIISAIGKVEYLNAAYFSEKQTVIDVGVNYNESKQKICGDVLYEEVEPIVDNITPVPGGVGSVTTAILLNQTILATKKMI